MKFSRDIQSLSVFKRDSAKFLKQMKKTGTPIVLTVNGKAAAVLSDPDEYQEYLRAKERQETIEGIRRGRADVKAGRTRPAEDVFRDLFERFGIPETE
jgi:prevent-host-death family protein